MSAPDSADLVVVGGGIVGLATAYRFGLARPEARVIVLEKEDAVASHQTGHNSGVLHSGLYYRPGSEKAKNCRRGKALMEDFCRAQGIPFEICGKVVVATHPEELPRLAALAERGRANGVDLEEIGIERLRELEPEAAGIAALHVREAGIVDYRAVCQRLVGEVRSQGGEVWTGARVTALATLPDAARVRWRDRRGAHSELRSGAVANCAGLHSDRVLASAGSRRQERIVPFRGEYFELRPAARGLVQNLIYPVPDPSFPFLGVHFTRTIAGGIECGPNAVPALAREGYGWSQVSVPDLLDVFGYAGFWRLARRTWRTGAGEIWRSLSKAAFVRALQRLLPAIRAEHLTRAPAGVRAQALSPAGALLDDFLIRTQGRLVHVLNAPSPAATSSLAIGERVARAILEVQP